jgi:hypothetical protein
MDTPQSTEKTADLTMNKQDEAAGLELGTFDSNPSADVLPGGRLPGSNDDVRFVTTRKELWSYYTYYVGNNGKWQSSYTKIVQAGSFLSFSAYQVLARLILG